MMSREQNDLLTCIGPGTPAGRLMRMYWQPAALTQELEGPRPIRPVRLLGENFVLFRDGDGNYGLMDRDCPHRGADLAFGRAACAARFMDGSSRPTDSVSRRLRSPRARPCTRA